MAADRPSGLSRFVRFVVLGMAFAAIPAALLFLEPPGGKADAATLTADAAAAFKTRDNKLWFAVNLTNANDKKVDGDLIVELLDKDGVSLGKQEKKVSQADRISSYQFEFPAPADEDGLKLRCVFGKEQIEVDVPKILLAKPHETSLSTSQEFYSGSQGTLRCSVQGVKSVVETVPLPGSSVNVKLVGKDGKVHELYEGKTGEDGMAQAEFKLPKLPSGDYKLEVATRSALGEEKLERQVKVKSEPKVMLVTDKPLYQPGQLMHVRALCLRPFDLTPVDQAEIVFEIEDAKGNKVFKRSLKTSDYGVASVDFQLADEVNMGGYQVRALVGDAKAQKTVEVKRYVLPKFKVAVTADKTFYLPKETVKGELQSDYFFGKPVANGKIKVTASTFDVQFKEFATWEGKTDANGHASFEIKLPDYFVGQPLQKGDALVKLEVKVTDTADHAETVGKTCPVADQPIKVSLIPEGGRLIPGMENRVYAAALYPDGSPAANCDVKFWKGREGKDKPHTTVKTNDAGLAEFRLTPKAEDFRQADWQPRNVEMVGGEIEQAFGPRSVMDVTAEAKDVKGNTARATSEFNSEPFGENVLLRLDKAVYRVGDTMNVEVQSSAGLPTTYFDVVKGGQTLLTKWLDVKDGKADTKMELPPGLFGTLELHAYQQLASGEIIRDSRVVYVHSRDDLKIQVKADRDVYLPGQDGKLSFTVTDAKGKPTAAALGVIIVDEAVYALQEMQPGLEKVYFTLQEELLKPQAQAGAGPMPMPGPRGGFGGPMPAPAPAPAGPAAFKPGVTIDGLVREPELSAEKQQIAQVLLTSVRPKPPGRWELDPAHDRKKAMAAQIQQLGWALFNHAAAGKDVLAYDKKAARWTYADGLLETLAKAGQVNEAALKDPFGRKLTLEGMAKVEKNFTPEKLGRGVTVHRLSTLGWSIINQANVNRAKWFKDGKWTYPDDVVQDAARNQARNEAMGKDAWGRAIKLVKRDKKQPPSIFGVDFFDYHELLSSGPDGKFDTADDVKATNNDPWIAGNGLWFDDANADRLGDGAALRRLAGAGGPMMEMAKGGFGGPPGAPAPARAVQDNLRVERADLPVAPPNTQPASGAANPPTRLREYFPETMLWQPALITNDQGRAELPLSFADSITTWRLSASASSRGGALGGLSAPLRVFQDFFVDLDLPISLTQDDEVAFPVAVYNYLKTPQTVTLDLQKEPWFDVVDDAGLTRPLDLKPGDVVGVKFRIKAKKIGVNPLTVKATGSKMSDAIKRTVEVVPNGQKVERVVSDRLTGSIKQTIEIPENALPDASKMLVKIYPGVFSQLVEGTEGILRMPGGCFEQTSSSAYPNILVVDYIKKARLASPELLMKSEQYLNAGYQRLLTFERPGGGFDWWGSGPPLVWLSAYGLHEFNDMSKVFPIDKGIIDRTQKWLMTQQNADGTWDKIGATHSESIERMGDPKLLLTSYVAWSLLDSGMRIPQLEKAIQYIRAHSADAKDNPYVLAMAANALAAWDPKDDSTIEVIKTLEKLKTEKPDIKAVCFPCGNGQSLAYSRGDSITIEATALAALAMLKTGQFTTSVNQALMYLVKSKDSSGTWGSTQATILSLKALLAGLGGTPHKGKAEFVLKVGGKEAGRGEVTEANADVLQLFDLKDHTKVGKNEVEIEVKGETNLMYQIVGRHFAPWDQKPTQKPTLAVDVEYDRTKLSTSDLLRAKATLKYTGETPTFNVIVDLGIPPGFTVDAGDFAEMVAAKKVEKFSVTSRQVILYLGDVKPGDVKTFEYSLKPKFPLRAKTPVTTVYEYYTPANRGTAAPVELTVSQ